MAVSDGSRLLAGLRRRSDAAHSELLIKTAAQLISAAGFAPRDIKKVAAVAGPGSFTGIRIGITFARTLSQTLNIPAVSINAFDAVALSAAVPLKGKRNLGLSLSNLSVVRAAISLTRPRNRDGSTGRPPIKKSVAAVDKIMVVIDALFPLVHWAVYDSSGQKKIAGPGLDNIETVSARFAPSGKSSQSWVFAGSALAVDKTRAVLSERFGRSAPVNFGKLESHRYLAPSPAALAALAAADRGGGYKTLKPLYLKEVYLRK